MRLITWLPLIVVIIFVVIWFYLLHRVISSGL